MCANHICCNPLLDSEVIAISHRVASPRRMCARGGAPLNLMISNQYHYCAPRRAGGETVDWDPTNAVRLDQLSAFHFRFLSKLDSMLKIYWAAWPLAVFLYCFRTVWSHKWASIVFAKWNYRLLEPLTHTHTLSRMAQPTMRHKLEFHSKIPNNLSGCIQNY